MLQRAGFETAVRVDTSGAAAVRVARFCADDGHCFVDGHLAVRESAGFLDIDLTAVPPRYRPAAEAACAGRHREARILLAGLDLPDDVVASAECEVHLAVSGTPSRSAYAGTFCEPDVVGDSWDGVVRGSPFVAEVEALVHFLGEYGGGYETRVRVHTSRAVAELATGRARARSETSERLVAAMGDRNVDLIFAPRDRKSAGYAAAQETARWLYAHPDDT